MLIFFIFANSGAHYLSGKSLKSEIMRDVCVCVRARMCVCVCVYVYKVNKVTNILIYLKCITRSIVQTCNVLQRG